VGRYDNYGALKSEAGIAITRFAVMIYPVWDLEFIGKS
jgi:hypothetical protein